MGILDDAIREHLELKRAHGASEAELKVQEAEAFGPVRQEDVPEPGFGGDETALLQPADLDQQASESLDEPEAAVPAEAPALEPDEPLGPDPHDHAQPVPAEPADHAIPDPHDHAHSEGKDPAWADDTELFAGEPAGPPAAGAPVPPPPPLEEDPRAFDTDEHLRPDHEPPEPVFGHRGAAPVVPIEEPVQDPPVEAPPVVEPPVEEPPVRAPKDASSEDVLEETPEFLQDAPEHDRLWFEQKPPRDFDFGE